MFLLLHYFLFLTFVAVSKHDITQQQSSVTCMVCVGLPHLASDAITTTSGCLCFHLPGGAKYCGQHENTNNLCLLPDWYEKLSMNIWRINTTARGKEYVHIVCLDFFYTSDSFYMKIEIMKAKVWLYHSDFKSLTSFLFWFSGAWNCKLWHKQ